MNTLSFSSLRARHAELLRASAAAASAERIAAIRMFVESVRLAGRDIVDDDDREYLRSLLTFWGNWLYNQTRTYPNTNIEPFTAEAAAKHGREAAEKIVKGKPIGAGQQNRLLIGGFTILGIISLSVLVVLLAVLISPLLFPGGDVPISAVATGTVESINATNRALVETFSPPTNTPLPIETAVVIVTPVSVQPSPTAGTTATATRAALPSTPTAISENTTTFATPLPETGGGGFGPPPVAVISVQVISPRSTDELAANQAFEISATYFNLQLGWKLFFVLNFFDTGESVFLPDSFAVPEDGATGVWTTRTAASTPGLYSVSVYIATHSAEIQRLQRWANSGQIVTSETQYDGVILFRDLTVFEVR